MGFPGKHGDHLEHRLEGPTAELLLYLVSVEVCSHQAEEVHVHLLQLAHPAHDVWRLGQPVKGTRWQARECLLPVLQFLPQGSRPTGSWTARGRRGAPQSYKSSGPGLGGQLPHAWVWALQPEPRPTGLPSHRAYLAGLLHTQHRAMPPARAAPSAGTAVCSEAPAVCLGKAEGRAVPLAASVSGAGTGSSLTPAFAQEGDTRT